MAKAVRNKSTRSKNKPAEPVAVSSREAPDITTCDPEGCTPLHLAAKYGYSMTVRRLLQFQADVHARDHAERTPAHWSAFKGHLDIVKLLVESGADVNARDTGGRTLLTMALIGQQTAVEAFLRARGGTT